jgi:hypothetical protein
MFQNRVPDRIKQIIWNDTANAPYSKENVARRLLVYFDYMPFMSNGREIVEKITGYTLKQQVKLSEKNEKTINDVMMYISKTDGSSKLLHERGSVEQQELQDTIEYIMQETLGLTNDQYLLLKEGAKDSNI